MDHVLFYCSLAYGKLRSYVQPYISTTFNASKICEGVYLGDISSAYNKEKLKEQGITHILCTILGVEPVFPNDFVYKNIYLRDVPSQEILNYLDECADFIDQAQKQGGKVLVHCMCGISRSASMVIAYLISKRSMQFEMAMSHVVTRRPIAKPNPGFQQQLINYEWKHSQFIKRSKSCQF